MKLIEIFVSYIKLVFNRKSISGRSTQSNLVICKTVYHTVESYGAPTPVQITEALAFSDSKFLRFSKFIFLNKMINFNNI